MNVLIKDQFGWRLFILFIVAVYLTYWLEHSFVSYSIIGVLLTIVMVVHSFWMPVSIKSIVIGLVVIVLLFEYFKYFDNASWLKTLAHPPFLRPLYGQIRIAILNWNISSKDQGLMLNLLLADRSMMSREVIRSFAEIGGAHLIALSGMHLGVIYWVADVIAKKLIPFKNVRSLTVLAIVGGYACLAGMSIPLLRAFLMVALYMFFERYGRRRDGLDQVFLVMCLVMLLIPGVWEDWGFQFSFAGVIGIIFGMRFIYPFFQSKNRYLNTVVQFVLVSVFAQLAVFPLIWYHTGTFPPYFLLTNVLLSPIIFVLIVAGVVLVIIDLFFSVEPMVWGLEWVLKLLWKTVDFLLQIPGHQIHLPEIDQLDVIIIYLLLIILLKTLLFRAFKNVLHFTLLLFLFLKKSTILWLFKGVFLITN